MTFNAIKQDIAEKRREMVSQLRLRGLSIREIADALGRNNPPLLNPETGKPYSHVTIKTDIDALELEWEKRRLVNTGIHKNRQFMLIQEVNRTAWATKEPELVLKALDREMKLLGTAEDKDGITINLYLPIIQQIITLAVARGDDPMNVFEGVAKRLQRANTG
jgi:hypothetical protein